MDNSQRRAAWRTIHGPINLDLLEGNPIDVFAAGCQCGRYLMKLDHLEDQEYLCDLVDSTIVKEIIALIEIHHPTWEVLCQWVNDDWVRITTIAMIGEEVA